MNRQFHLCSLFVSVIFLISLSSNVNFVRAKEGLVGACETKNYSTISVDLSRFFGVWYEQAHSASFYWDEDCFCTTATYSPTQGNELFDVENSCRLRAPEGDLYQRNATATQPDRQSEPGHFVINFGPFEDAPYDVVYVDDTYNYLIVVSCSPIPFFGGSNIWILSKKSSIPDSILNGLIAKVSGMGFDVSDLVKTSQDGCFGNDVPSIDSCYIQPPPVNNFDLSKFLGQYNIIVQRADFIENLFTWDCTCTHVTITPIPGSKVHFSNEVGCTLKYVGGKYNHNLTLEEIHPVYNSHGIYNIRNFDLYNEHWQILSFDDSSYSHALLYNCFSLIDVKTYCWYILSRDKTLDERIVQKYLERVKEFGLIYDNMERIAQNCTD